MKIKYRPAKLANKSLAQLVVINDIIKEYQADGYVLTLRQLYYQLVSRDIVPNEQKEYAKLSGLLKEGRMGGLVDWNAIEDRLRKPSSPSSWNNPKDFMESVVPQFAMDRMKGQPVYLEVWVEKDALSGVLSRVTRPYHIPIVVNRGYSSVTAMHDAYNRFDWAGIDKPKIILYLGDHDPSGLDMIRDINDRIMEFYHGSRRGDNFSVIHIALTIDQIQEYNPPPNPAKVSDPRSTGYIKRHGNVSWEVDALKPEILNRLLEDVILEHIDIDQYNLMIKLEKVERDKLKKLTEKL